MISNRLIRLRARRTFPTRPALLVGPSRLLRGEKVQDPSSDGPRNQSPERGRNCRFQHTKRNVGTLRGIPMATCVEANTCHACREDGCAIQSSNPSSVYFPNVLCGSLAPAYGSNLYFLATSRKGRVRWSGTFCVSRMGQGSGLK